MGSLQSLILLTSPSNLVSHAIKLLTFKYFLIVWWQTNNKPRHNFPPVVFLSWILMSFLGKQRSNEEGNANAPIQILSWFEPPEKFIIWFQSRHGKQWMACVQYLLSWWDICKIKIGGKTEVIGWVLGLCRYLQ